MMRISDIMEKEIINVKNGKKLGFITDIDLDVENGKVSSFSITGSSGNFFYRGRNRYCILERHFKNRL